MKTLNAKNRKTKKVTQRVVTKSINNWIFILESQMTKKALKV